MVQLIKAIPYALEARLKVGEDMEVDDLKSWRNGRQSTRYQPKAW